MEQEGGEGEHGFMLIPFSKRAPSHGRPFRSGIRVRPLDAPTFCQGALRYQAPASASWLPFIHLVCCSYSAPGTGVTCHPTRTAMQQPLTLL